MAFLVIPTDNADLMRVQLNIKKELDALELQLAPPGKPSTPVTTDYTVTLNDILVLANPVSTLNVTLPEVSTCPRRTFTIKNVSAAGLVSVRGLFVLGVFQSLENVQRYDIPSGTSVTCYSDGSKWWVV